MEQVSEPQTQSMRAVNEEATLYEVTSRDIWQCEVVTRDGACIGRAIRQIIEPRAYAVRYLVVYDALREQRLLLPATLVSGAEPGAIICTLTVNEAQLLMVYPETLTREYEATAYSGLNHPPYWEEEDTNPSGFDPLI